jgi:hypothetical protein
MTLMTNCGLPLGSVLLSTPDSARAIHPLSKVNNGSSNMRADMPFGEPFD